MATPKILAIPCKLDAFVLNPAVSGGTSKYPNEDGNKNHAKIAPLAQPNYTYLRFEKKYIQNDILNFTDLHKTGPAPFNPRLTDLGTGEPLVNRQGIYLHWIVPRPYRTGSTISQDKTTQERARELAGFKPHRTTASTGDLDDPPITDDSTAPDFHPAPPRWLVIRKVVNSEPPNVLPEVDGWVVESDRRHKLDDIPTTADLQVDYSPYILGGDAENLDGHAIQEQADVFIGYREAAASWRESYDPKKPKDQQPARVDLNLLSSSNQLFADYQPHNSNVFSIIDNLQYKDAEGKTKSVQTANVNYYVLGWHSASKQDPLGNLGNVTRGERLAALNMTLDQLDAADDGPIKDWLQSKDPSRVLCHGAMYNVLWDSQQKPSKVPADEYYEKLNRDMPVAVGTTPSDAIQAYVNAHSGDNPAADDAVTEIKKDLLRLQKLRFSSGDSVEDQAEASDMLYDGNFSSSEGGGHYFLATSDGGKGDKGRPTSPDPEVIDGLTALNNSQRYLDTLNRQLQLLRWGMFALWWQYVTDLEPTATKKDVEAKSKEILALMQQIEVAVQAVQDGEGRIPSGMAEKGVLPPFFQAQDPTMLVAGIETGWACDFLNLLKTRVDTEFYFEPGSAPKESESWDSFCKTVLPNLPVEIQTAAGGLIDEFIALDPGVASPPTPQTDYRVPLYHDQDQKHLPPGEEQPWRDRWEKSQAWFPLFLEWEAEYTDIPFAPKDPMWTLDERGAWPHDPVKLRYGIAPDIELAHLQPPLSDKRTVSGRVLLLPQAQLELVQNVTQALEDSSGEGLLDPDQMRGIKDELKKMSFLSSPLSGFTDHLLTRVQGNHIKPSVRDGGSVKPFTAAIDVGKDVGFLNPQLTMMGIETDLVPYGTLVSYLDDNYCPFKPVTHGQFRFTALNIIDKFGQAITAIDPTPRKDTEGPPPLYPCISEYYAPQSTKDDPEVANTVAVVPDPPGCCQYVQLPPSVNQPARLNAEFVDYLPDDPKRGISEGWQVLNEWDDPIWGWVVPNYADSGIQLFLADGTFFREIRVGGPQGAAASGAWLPFPKPKLDPKPKPKTSKEEAKILQLQLLADQLADEDYLHSFIAMVNKSTETAAPPPSAYSEFLSAIIGKPLALVKAGYSLELATDELSNTSTIDGPPKNPKQPLLPSSSDPNNHYSFQMQLGDASRVYDGLIAYFLPSKTPKPGDALDLGTLYTHFVPVHEDGDPPTPNLTKIEETNYPVISPFWVDPMDADIVKAKDPGAVFAAKRTAQLQPLGAIVDPFVPLHAYTGILPTGALQVPNWTWQQALSRMTAFFHMGPLLTTTDAPAFQEKYEVGPDNYNVAKEDSVLIGSGLGIPALQSGQWAWLQPYEEGSKSAASQRRNSAESGAPNFMAMDMAAVDERPRFEAAPYTALEGYMQLRRPIQQEATPAK